MNRTRSRQRRPASPAAPAGIAGVIVLALILIFARAPFNLNDIFDQGPTAADLCDEAIPWSEAWEQAAQLEGSVHAVEGTVHETSYVRGIDGRPTFINLGAAHPDTPRFEAIIWERNRGPFLEVFSEGPEQRLEGETVCVAGTVEIHNGVPQIELENPAQLLLE